MQTHEFVKAMLQAAMCTHAVNSGQGVFPYWQTENEPSIDEEFKAVLSFYTDGKAVTHVCELTGAESTLEAMEAVLAASMVCQLEPKLVYSAAEHPNTTAQQLQVSFYPICKWEGFFVLRLHGCRFVPETMHLFRI